MTKDIKQIQEENRKLCKIETLVSGDFNNPNPRKFPLTLSRVLLALEKKFCYFHLMGGKDLLLIEISVDTGKIEKNGDPIYFEFNWDIKKETLEEQSEKTQRAIWQLLKGGNNGK